MSMFDEFRDFAFKGNVIDLEGRELVAVEVGPILTTQRACVFRRVDWWREVPSKRRNCSREDTRRDSQEGERGVTGGVVHRPGAVHELLAPL